MKGFLKAVHRAPHQLTSKVGMSKKTADLEFDDYQRKFTAIEQGSEKILNDSSAFRDAVQNLLHSGSSFSGSLSTLFAPLGAEYDLSSKFPNSQVTITNMGAYQALMEDLREALTPELELIESRVVEPCKELKEVCKRIRKTLTKRDHKLIDFDRHSNSLNKLRNKGEKSLSDEKNLFKVEQDFEVASTEYEHWNNLCKAELPFFFKLSTTFVEPIFYSFYYMQLNVFYMMSDKLREFAEGKYDTSQTDIESIYMAQRGDAAERLDELTITKRMTSTAKMLSNHRTASGSYRPGSGLDRKASSASHTPSLARQSSTSKYGVPPPPPSAAGTAVTAPPPYTNDGASPAAVASASSLGKKAPPPPPPMKKSSSVPAPQYCVALYDFAAQAEGDLSFNVGDRIQIIERSDSQDDWWTGKVNGVSGSFPGSYTQLE